MKTADMTDEQFIAYGNKLASNFDPSKMLVCDYTNWKGEKRTRKFIPEIFAMGSNEWHPEWHLQLTARDADTLLVRYFKVESFDTNTLRVEDRP
jgi:hypothetical protein